MVGRLKIFITIFILIKCGLGVPRLDPLVETKVGLIRGLRASDGDYSMFMGIPYATVDATNPFGPSIPHPGFNETFDAYDDSAICPQIEEFNNSIVGTLDCLHLNIYVPDSASSQNRLPVLVWIYGGGFIIGFSGRYLYGPKYLVRHDVILVTLNYRLGPYGFMCLDIPEVPGNQGLKDQLTALRWIKNNIESFGGNSNDITIFGESAGGMSVDFHLHSEHEKLFNKVIMQSGTALLNKLIDDSDNTTPIKLAEQLGLETSNVNEALSFISNIDPHLVIAASNEAKLSFKVCVENRFDGVESFVSDYTVMRDIPKAKTIPILIGFNSDEMLHYNVTTTVFEENLQQNFNFDGDTLPEVIDIVKHFYIGDEIVSETNKEAISAFSSDLVFNYPTLRSITRYIENGAESVYFYVFSYDGDRNFVKDKDTINVPGAVHADEIGYLFDISYWNDDSSYADQVIVDRMTEMWTNFAKFGNPTPETSALLPVTWEPVKKDTPLYYLDINSELELKTRPFNERMAFWDLFYKNYWTLQKGYKEQD